MAMKRNVKEKTVTHINKLFYFDLRQSTSAS